uniref:Uncharacterized protein n=1 Tax=Oncorhynchus mykiss TaxID=8022 RepID=A0A8K9WS98_ONCMY
MYQCLCTSVYVPERRMFKQVYQISCLCVTDSDCRDLATDALEGFDLRDLRCLELINSIEERKKRGESDKELFLSDVYAYQGKFHQSKDWLPLQSPQLVHCLIHTHTWTHTLNPHLPQTPSDRISSHPPTRLIDIVRKLDNAEHHGYSSETYSKMGDLQALVQLHVEARYWDQSAFKRHSSLHFPPPSLQLSLFTSFSPPPTAFHKAGGQSDAVKVLKQLTHNAVVKSRFNEAAYYYWIRSMQCLDITRGKGVYLVKFRHFQQLAELYHVYRSIQRYTDEPFSSHIPETLFNISRYFLHNLTKDVPLGITKVNTLYALAKQSRTPGEFELARPSRFQETMDLGSLTVCSKPLQPGPDLHVRCSTNNPLLDSQGSVCINCKQPLIYTASSYGRLTPFYLDEGIGDEEAVSVIAPEVPRIDRNAAKGGSDYVPVVVSRSVLRSMSSRDVLLKPWPKPLHINMCRFYMFHSEDYKLPESFSLTALSTADCRSMNPTDLRKLV